MADVSTPLGASPANRRKVVLLGLGSKSCLDVNKSLFDWANVNIVDEEDDEVPEIGIHRELAVQRGRGD